MSDEVKIKHDPDPVALAAEESADVDGDGYTEGDEQLIDSVIASELDKEQMQEEAAAAQQGQGQPIEGAGAEGMVPEPPNETTNATEDGSTPTAVAEAGPTADTPAPAGSSVMTGILPGVIGSPIVPAYAGPSHRLPSQAAESVPNMPPLGMSEGQEHGAGANGMPPLDVKPAAISSDSGPMTPTDHSSASRGENIFASSSSQQKVDTSTHTNTSNNIFHVPANEGKEAVSSDSKAPKTTGDEFEDGIGVIEGNHAYYLASEGGNHGGHGQPHASTPVMNSHSDQWGNAYHASYSTQQQPPPLKGHSSSNNIFMSPPPTYPHQHPSSGRSTNSNRGTGRGRMGSSSTPRQRKKQGAVASLTVAGPNGTILPVAEQHRGGTGEERHDADGNIIHDGVIHPPNTVWYSGSVALGLDGDRYWLSELQVFLRSNFAEAFSATEEDIAAPMHGRNKPIALGQVGIRCIWCRDVHHTERCNHAVSYPSQISGIYNSVQNMLRNHFEGCAAIPEHVRMKIRELQSSNSNRGGRKQYWTDSARRLGLVDTPHGVHFERDPRAPLPPLSGPSAGHSYDTAEIAPFSDGHGHSFGVDTVLMTQEHSDEMKRQKEETYPIVLPEDKTLISDYIYLALEQMEPCKLMDADRVGCYKTQTIGFPGLACRWCVGQAGRGRYFPATETSLSQTTTSQTILNHVMSCQHVPIDIRQKLDLMKRSKIGPDGKKCKKPRHGGRKVFFHRLWCRIQGMPIDEMENIEVKIGRQKGAKNKSRERTSTGRGKRAKTSEYTVEYSDGAYGSDTHYEI